ncbi:MAG: cytochrome c oxidase assembly protein, partial [Bacilli bacterium]
MPNHTHHVTAGFFELWNPTWIVITCILIAGYLFIVEKSKGSFVEAEVVPFMQKFYFISGLIMLYVAQGTPLSYYGHHYLFSFHMMQMAIMFLIVPPLLLLGTPAWLLRPILGKPAIKKIFGFITNPLIAILLFNGLFSFYHLPSVFDAVMSHPLLHTSYHLILFASAMLMYWLIVCPVPEFNRLSPLLKLAYIFGNVV